MKHTVAIIGDVHGNLTALEEIVYAAKRRAEVIVFVGDYINRGPRSADVIGFLVDLAASPVRATFLRGNHERAFLRYLDGGLIADFLRIGGAATLRSYSLADGSSGCTDFRKSVPAAHIQFLRDLRDNFWAGELLVTHSPTDPLPLDLVDAASPIFRVAGHLPQPGYRPRVSNNLALIDTGCGTWCDGPLTCFFWPTGDWIQAR